MIKKIILFIVEGSNDQKEISAIINSSLFRKYKEKYYFDFAIHSDITSDTESNEGNILSKIENIITKYRKNNLIGNLSPSDIYEVVQVVDLDGCFVNRDRIVRDECRLIYDEDCIRTDNQDNIWGRNKRKTKILNKLVKINKISNIMYSVYYVSCNMDHVLFDLRNPLKNQKNEKAMEFALKCKEDENILFKTIFSKEVASNLSYDESWEYVKSGTVSLHRCTNLNLFFNERAKNKK